MSKSLLAEDVQSGSEEQQQSQNQQPQESQATSKEESNRPEWLPEKYNDIDAFVAGHKELESKFGKGKEAMKEEVIAEYKSQQYANRPGKAGDYQVPQSLDDSMAADNPLLNWWAEQAWNMGLDQAGFEAGIDEYVKGMNHGLPDYDEEVKKLGDNAKARQEAVTLFVKDFFDDPEMSESLMVMTSRAGGIFALEKIMNALRDAEVSPQVASANAGLTEEKLREMMNDPRYWNPNQQDRAFIKRVDEGFKKLYPD